MLTRTIRTKHNGVEKYNFPDAEFNFETFKGLSHIQDMIYYCDKYLRRIGSGFSRIVYHLSENKVIKISTEQYNKEQNINENYIFSKASFCLTKIYDTDTELVWIVAEYAEAVVKQDFENILGCSFEDILKWYHEGCNGKDISNNLWFQEFKKLCDLGINDIDNIDAWGKVKENGIDKLVIKDYGFLNKNDKNLYSTL